MPKDEFEFTSVVDAWMTYGKTVPFMPVGDLLEIKDSFYAGFGSAVHIIVGAAQLESQVAAAAIMSRIGDELVNYAEATARRKGADI